MFPFRFLDIPQNTAQPLLTFSIYGSMVHEQKLWFPLNSQRSQQKMFWILIIKLFVSVEMRKTIYDLLIEVNEHETNGLTTDLNKSFRHFKFEWIHACKQISAAILLKNKSKCSISFWKRIFLQIYFRFDSEGLANQRSVFERKYNIWRVLERSNAVPTLYPKMWKKFKLCLFSLYV